KGFPVYTMYVVYLGYSMCYLAVTFIFAKKYCGLSIHNYLSNVVYRCIIILIVALGFSLIPKYFMTVSIIRLIIIVVLSSVSLVALTLLIGFNNSELISIKRLIKAMQKKLKDITFGKDDNSKGVLTNIFL
ncbi:hypothetical protein LC612_43890, partial [Nostoc sp. CHAB 5834]|nr:hypothetical protein [Nostoc sp. CHAB 5834]